MEEKREMQVTTTVTVHDFYCDSCGEFIGSVTERNDGYYSNPWNCNIAIYAKDWLQINKTLCPKCKQKFFEEITERLRDIGFEYKELEVVLGES